MTLPEELDDNIVEPITLEEVKDYLGYSQYDTKDDALLNRLITTARSMVEDGLDRIIVRRHLRMNTNKVDGPYELKPYVHEVTSVSYEIYDREIKDWIVVDTMDYEYDPGEDAKVYAHFPRDAKNIQIDYVAGFTQIPEAIKMAMLEIVKMKFDRSASDPFSIVRPSIQKWKVENL